MAPSGPIIWAEGKDTVEADVVFVHGLRGHALRTWSKDDICWPRDFLKADLENARIISWGYDSSVLKPTRRSSQASIFDHSENLLNDLASIRTSPSAAIRPIIFVGHSLGGLVIKEALIRAAEYVSNDQHVDLGRIYKCTGGVVFIGTPHRGSGKAGIAEIISGIVKIGLQNPNDRLVEVLAQDSQVLERQMKSFTSISNTMPIACITEEVETGIGMIVPTQSATLQGHTVRTSSVPANHMDMCRFTKSDDIGYQRISHHIITFARQAAHNAQARFTKGLINALAYKEMNDREDQITEAYTDTFTWLLPTEKVCGDDELNPKFVEWIKDENSSLYWLNGKAGSGKSTLMKNVFSNPNFRALVESWAKPAKVTFCGFFFFDRGKSMLQKSRNGLMRSLLYQILDKHRELGHVAFASRYKSWTLHDHQAEPYRFDWDWSELSAAFATILNYRDNNMRLCVFVDGLDEYSLTEGTDLEGDEEEDIITQRIEQKAAGHSEIAKIFLDVAKVRDVKLCVSSRPLLRFESAFKGVPQMRLQDHTSADIATYVNGRLAQNEMMVDLTQRDPANAELLISTIVDRASGVFLWVRLVVDRLLNSLEDHDTLIEMQRTVDSLPRELGGRKGLYIRMIEDMKPAFRVQAAKYFRIIQKSRDPLSLLSLSFMETQDINSILKMPVQQLSHAEAEFESKWMEGRLKSRCVGLLEAVPLPPSKKKTFEKRRTNGGTSGKQMTCIEPQIMVQFLHQTAKEFLEQDFVWDIVFNQPAMQQFNVNTTLVGLSLLRLKKVGLDGVDDYDGLVGVWEIIFDALHYALKAEQESEELDKVELLLDDLDATAAVLLENMNNFGQRSSKFSHLHWTDTEPEVNHRPELELGHRTFLILAMECNLLSYVTRKLEKGAVQRKRRTLLLANAIIPKPKWFRVRAADTEFSSAGKKPATIAMMRTILDHGADPNERIPHRADGLSVWQAALTVDLGSTDQQHMAEILKLLVLYGANLSARIPKGDRLQSVLYTITAAIQGSHGIRTDLVRFLKSKGARYLQVEREEPEVQELEEEEEEGEPEEKDQELDRILQRDADKHSALYSFDCGSSMNSYETFEWSRLDSRWKEIQARAEKLGFDVPAPPKPEPKSFWGYYDFGATWKHSENLNYWEACLTKEEEKRKVQGEINFHLQRLEELEKSRFDLSSSDSGLTVVEKSQPLKEWNVSRYKVQGPRPRNPDTRS